MKLNLWCSSKFIRARFCLYAILSNTSYYSIRISLSRPTKMSGKGGKALTIVAAVAVSWYTGVQFWQPIIVYVS